LFVCFHPNGTLSVFIDTLNNCVVILIVTTVSNNKGKTTFSSMVHIQHLGMFKAPYTTPQNNTTYGKLAAKQHQDGY